MTNYWLESLDYLDFCTHFNHETAVVDTDGKYRFLISPIDPRISNWLNTGGHDRGCIAMRWIFSNSDSLAKTEVLKLDEAVAKISALRRN